MKLVLDIDKTTGDFFEGSRLLGIMIPVKNYRFCWMLNHYLPYDFCILPDVDLHIKKKNRDYHFPVYHSPDSQRNVDHYVYQNQDDGEYLIPQFRNLDFLWLIKGDEIDQQFVKDLIALIKPLKGLQMISELDFDGLKHKENLVI